jgi:succinyl-diaminopimelate desuccinylase
MATGEIPPPAPDTPAFDADAVIALTSALVRLRTVNTAIADAVEAPAVALVADVMRDFGWTVTVTEVAPGRPSVVGVVDGSAPGRTLMFEGHVDVVTEGDPAAWSFPPYSGAVVDGRLLGRGSADMKSGAASPAAWWSACSPTRRG